MKRWWLLALLSTLFLAIAVATAIAAVVTDEPFLWTVPGVCLLSALMTGWSARRMRAEENMDRTQPPPAPAGKASWDEVAARLRERFAGTPIAVESEGGRIRVRADLANRTFFTPAGLAKRSHVEWVDVVAVKPGQAVTRDVSQRITMRAGVAHFTGSAETTSGRSWSYSRSVEYGADFDGNVGRMVDVHFTSSQLRKPINEVLKETGWYAGWYRSLPAEARGALTFVVVMTVVSVVALVVLALMGEL